MDVSEYTCNTYYMYICKYNIYFLIVTKHINYIQMSHLFLSAIFLDCHLNILDLSLDRILLQYRQN